MEDLGTVLRSRYPDMVTLLSKIRERPGMFLGRPTISGLHLFLNGISFAEDYYSLKDRITGFDWDRFEQWIEHRFNPRKLSLGSFGLARENANDEESGFDLWFAWYDEFRSLETEVSERSE